MKILIVAQYFPPDITAAAFRMFDTARLLEVGGHEVRVITAYPHRSQASGDSLVEYDGLLSGVWRARVAHLNGGGLIDYIRHYASFMVGSGWLGLRQWMGRWRPDVIWASSPPLFVGLSGIALARLFRVPLVADIRDIWPASAVAAGQLSAHGRACRYGEKMERYVYGAATHITCVARPMQEYIRTQTKTPVAIVYNGVKTEDIVACSKLAERHGRDGNTLLYAGNLGRAQQLDLLIRAWANVRREDACRHWTLAFLGAGVVEGDLKALSRRLDMGDSVAFMPPVSRRAALKEMAKAAALAITLRPDKVFERTIPSKVFDCMAAGRPILAGVAGEGKEILEATGANVCCDPGSREGLEQALRRLVHDYTHLRQRACRNPEAMRNTFTREQAVASLANVLRSVVSNGRGT